MRRILMALGRQLGQARVLVLTPIPALYMLAFDMSIRLASVRGSDRLLQRLVDAALLGLVVLLRVCWGMTLKIDPRLGEALRQPGATVIVANHHSPLDIPVLLWVCRRRSAYFVCRPGLDRGMPGVSPLVRRRCVVLQSNARENRSLLWKLGQHLEQRDGVAIIFPEGRKTPGSYPQLLPFRTGGLSTLVEAAPSSRVIAVALHGTRQAWPGPWGFPRGGVTVEARLAAVENADPLKDPRALARSCEVAIRRTLHATGPEQRSRGSSEWTSSPTL